MNKIKDRILKSRKLSGFTQKEVSDKLRISQAAYAKIESGDTNISVKRLFEIAEVLNTSVSFILGIDETDKGFVDKKSNLESERDKLKVLVFNALEEYESTQVLLKSGILDENVPEDNKKFTEYREYLREFKNGIYSTFVSRGFCTIEDIKAFKDYRNPNKK